MLDLLPSMKLRKFWEAVEARQTPLPTRSRNADIYRRHTAQGAEHASLGQLARQYNISRERVRQIVAQERAALERFARPAA